MAEQRDAGAVVWTACTPSVEDLGQADVDATLGVGCLPLLERDRGQTIESGEEDLDHLLASASQVLEFHRCALSPELSRIRVCCLFSGSD